MNMDLSGGNLTINISIGQFMMMVRIFREENKHARFIVPHYLIYITS